MLNAATLSLPGGVDSAPTTRVFDTDYYELKTRLAEAIANSSYRSISKIDFELRDDAVVLLGHLPSFFLKQIAQTMASQVIKARLSLINEVHVSEAVEEHSALQEPAMCDAMLSD